jgi:ankyrin repeat protein
MTRFWIVYLCVNSAHIIVTATTATTTTTIATNNSKTTTPYKVNQFATTTAAKYLCLPPFSRQVTMGENESHSEETDESSSLLGGVFSGGISGPYRESGRSSSTQYEPLQEESEEVDVDRVSCISEAIENGHPEALGEYLTNDTTYVCAIESQGNTFLHNAVLSTCQYGYSFDGYYQCVDLLMTCQEMKVNMPNKKSYTAIGCALNELNKTCVERMLKHPSAKRLYLDCYHGDSEFTVRDIVMQTYPDLQPLLPAPVMESLDSSDRDIKLLAALQHDKYDIFIETLDPNNPNPWYDEPYHSSLLEIACQMKDRKRFVKLLLDKVADPNIKNCVTGMPLLHATARSGNYEVLQLLMGKGGKDTSPKDYKDRTILHWLAQVREREPDDKYILENCFKVSLDKDSVTKMDIDFRDVSGNTALYIALQNGFRDRAKLLLSKGADVSVRGKACQVLLPTTIPILEEILDDCLLSNDELLTSKDLQLSLNKEVLTNIVTPIVESQHLRELLKHPVISTFLYLKWLKVRYIFFIDMAFYVIFLCCLTTYILLSEPYNTLNDGVVASNTTDIFSFNDGNITSGINDSNYTSQTKSRNLRFLQNFLMISLFLLTLKKMKQLIVHQWVYIKLLQNWLEILLIISTFISCSGVVESAELKNHSSAVALLLGWLEMLMLSGRLPLLSVQYEMLRTVILTFLWYMMGYVTLLIAFALSFYILFKGSSEQGGENMFANPPISLLKTIVMFRGEFDISSLSFDTLPYTSHVIFLLFVVLVAIVLLNLLNGLAVNDTGEIRKNAETLSLVARAKLISRIERLVNALPKFMKTSVEWKKEMFVIYPNRRNKIGSALVETLLQIISQKTKTHDKDKSTEFQKELWMIADKMSALERQQKELEGLIHLKQYELQQILMQIQTHLRIGDVDNSR